MSACTNKHKQRELTVKQPSSRREGPPSGPRSHVSVADPRIHAKSCSLQALLDSVTPCPFLDIPVKLDLANKPRLVGFEEGVDLLSCHCFQGCSSIGP